MGSLNSEESNAQPSSIHAYFISKNYGPGSYKYKNSKHTELVLCHRNVAS